MQQLRLGVIGVGFALALGAVALSGLREASAEDAPEAVGHCQFSLKNQWAGPFKVCQAPATSEQCAALGKMDENSAAVWGQGVCPAAGLVGSCKRESDTVYYYEGDAGSLEIGCGFQGGTWSAGK